MKKVMVFEQAELPYVYGVCGLDHTHGNPKTGFLCEGNRPIDDFEKSTVKNKEVGEVFWTKAEFGVDVVIANGNERINDSNMSLFGNVDEEHSFNKILDENLQRLLTADEFVDIVLDYQMSFLNDDTLEFEYDEWDNSDEIKAQWCSNNRDIDEGNDECYYDGKIVWHTVYIKNTVCEDCVKTEFMWEKETQAQTYTVGLINGGFEICDEPTNLKSYEKVEVREGEPWYGISEMSIAINVKGILNDEKSMDDVIETLKKMPNREFMQMVKEGFDDGYIELLFSNCPYTNICDFCDKDSLAKGKKGLEYTISHLNNTFVNFEVEVKFMFWIDEGKIKCKPIWEFEK